MYVNGLARLFQTGVAGVVDTLSRLDDSEQSGPIIARVTDVCLNSNSDLFKTAGWGGIGSISFQALNDQKPESGQNRVGSTLALPMFPQFKNYPLVDEFVILFPGAGQSDPQSSGVKQYYYIPLNIWNNPHYNGYPNTLNEDPKSQESDYEEMQDGNPSTENNNPEKLPINGQSGGQFVEKGDIHPILPFAGDQIIEGRNSNSIRLGSTATTKGSIRNTWSSYGDEGSPILIIKNGQPENVEGDSWVPTVEDINRDPSSLYLTSTQKIPIVVATSTLAAGEKETIPFTSVINKTPISPKTFTKSQVILNSGRLLFNTVGDSILMSSQKSIILESREDLGIKSMFNNVNILAPKGNISMGKRNADQSAVLGDNLMEYLVPIMKNMKTLVEKMTKEPQLTTSKIPAQTLIEQFNTFITNYQKALSDKIKLS
jgi:hypothetical protein